jgi:hypothetical protein
MSRRRARCPEIVALLAVLAAAAPAAGQEVDDEDPAPPADPESAESEGFDDYARPTGAPFADWGVGLRLRYVFLPKGMIELFLEEVPSGVGHGGIGIEATRRKGDFEMSFGLEYESLAPDDGFFREKGGGDDPASVSADTDFTEFDGFGWVTLDATFVFHNPLNDKFALRYGAGFGLGIITGRVLQTDSTCTSTNIQEDCTAITNPGPGNDFKKEADVPPVFPVVSLLVGAQYRATDKISVNLEVGLRTIFYTGIGATYFF